MKAKVDENICIGCAMCVSMCETVFSMNDNGLSEAILEDIPSEHINDAEEARDCCPVDAISIQ